MCLPIVGGIVSGIGAAMGALGQAASYRAQGKLAERQAGIERTTGAYKAGLTQDNVDKTIGAQRAGFAANGLALTGSPADTIADTSQEGALDVAAIRWNSKLNADNLIYQSKVDKMNAGIATAAAPLAFLSPTINGVATYQSSFG